MHHYLTALLSTLFIGLLSFPLPSRAAEAGSLTARVHKYNVYSHGYVFAHKGRALGEEADPILLDIGADEEPSDPVTPLASIGLQEVVIYNMSTGARIGDCGFKIVRAAWDPEKKRVAVTWTTLERNNDMDIKEYYIDLVLTLRCVKK